MTNPYHTEAVTAPGCRSDTSAAALESRSDMTASAAAPGPQSDVVVTAAAPECQWNMSVAAAESRSGMTVSAATSESQSGMMESATMPRSLLDGPMVATAPPFDSDWKVTLASALGCEQTVVDGLAAATL